MMDRKWMIACVGAASAALFGVAAAKGPGAMFDRLDADGDGTVSQAEFDAAHKAMFERADADGDGAVSKAEAEALREGRGRGGHGGGRGGDHHGKADANGDGVVSYAEHVAAAEARFDKLDRNGDGVISDDERPRRGHRGGPPPGDEGDDE